MEPGEVAGHVRRKWRQWRDARQSPDSAPLALEPTGAFPKLPRPEDAPNILREALAADSKEIRAGRWKAFGHIELQVDDPPLWHRDYLAGKDLATNEVAFKLDHRELPGGADVKLIWELSRWQHLTRLAMSAYVLDDQQAASKCVEWLEDWARHNPPYRGWNWTSALEAGMRLVQFTWIDALLGARPRLSALRTRILPAHVWFTWRYRSFGSSANNHLIGELAGLILALSRWPELAKWSAPLDTLRRLWEREVLAQFAEDGGNREQALNYHLFSWEFCWQARAALIAAGREITSEADERLRRAAQYYVDVQVPSEPWDYGDSDNALVIPMFIEGKDTLVEWRNWFAAPTNSAALEYWCSTERKSWKFEAQARKAGDGWLRCEKSGYFIRQRCDWTLRWDLSPLGYLATAAHGHLDALHLSLWRKGKAIVIDPGTGAYYGDRQLREWLASRHSHNGPELLGVEWPRRSGPFLWSEHHRSPQRPQGGDEHLIGFYLSPPVLFTRDLRLTEDGGGWIVEDGAGQVDVSAWHPFSVRWQFAPGTDLQPVAERWFRVAREGVTVEILVSEDWAQVFPVPEQNARLLTSAATNEMEARYAGMVSPAFRKVQWAPFLKLVARPEPGKPCLFRTTFLASRDS